MNPTFVRTSTTHFFEPDSPLQVQNSLLQVDRDHLSCVQVFNLTGNNYYLSTGDNGLTTYTAKCLRLVMCNRRRSQGEWIYPYAIMGGIQHQEILWGSGPSTVVVFFHRQRLSSKCCRGGRMMIKNWHIISIGT